MFVELKDQLRSEEPQNICRNTPTSEQNETQDVSVCVCFIVFFNPALKEGHVLLPGEVTELRNEMNRSLKEHLEHLSFCRGTAQVSLKSVCLCEICLHQNSSCDAHTVSNVCSAAEEINEVRGEMFELKNQSSGLIQKLKEHLQMWSFWRRTAQVRGNTSAPLTAQTCSTIMFVLAAGGLNQLKSDMFELKNQSSRRNQELREDLKLLQENSSGEVTQLRSEVFEMKNQSSRINQSLKEHLELLQRNSSGEVNRLKSDVFELKNQSSRLNQELREMWSFCRGTAQVKDWSLCLRRSEKSRV
ncbi:hypothetical protein WMY93_033369 [Mugilogobius chulae]|uniref:Uncharacterized protein n=1 Tax=Mugilogobius chulae TaxID=88201 RepID=A0AAW0MKY0_9GOBI